MLSWRAAETPRYPTPNTRSESSGGRVDDCPVRPLTTTTLRVAQVPHGTQRAECLGHQGGESTVPTRVTSWTRGLVTWLGVDVALLEDPITSRAAFLLDVASVDGDRLAHDALARGGAVGKVGRWCCATQSANGAARRATLYSYPSAGVARARSAPRVFVWRIDMHIRLILQLCISY